MKRLTSGLVLLALIVPLSGCIVHTNRRGHAVHRDRCHPSEYWDGHKCKHKGKGHDHRKDKHDHRH